MNFDEISNSCLNESHESWTPFNFAKGKQKSHKTKLMGFCLKFSDSMKPKRKQLNFS